MSRLLGFITVVFLGFFIFQGASHASAGLSNPQTQSNYQTVTPQSYQPQLGANVTPNLGVLTQGILIETLAALSCQLAGIDPLDPYGRCIGVDPSTRQLTRADKSDGGAIAFVTRGIAGTYSIPVSSTQYLVHLRENFGITKSAYAQQLEQSYGFRSLYPILEIWKGFRNIVFLFFVLVFSAIGIGIMFRLHVDARAVMTVQNQIPKIVIGLILISFSYAIAGLMIDFMYALIFLFFNVAAQMYESIGIDPVKFPGLNSNAIGFVNTLYSPHDGFSDLVEFTFVGRAITGVMNSGIMSVTMGASLSVGQIVGNLFDGVLDSTIGSLFKLLMSPLSVVMGPVSGACSIVDSIPGAGAVTGAISSIPVVGGLFGGARDATCGAAELIQDLPKLIIQSITSLIAFLVILIAILFSLFKLWFTLIKAYIFILLDIVFAPFWIAAGLLPKGGLGWWAWFRSVMANLSVFPVTIGVLLIGKIFMDTFGKGGSDHFVPPLIGDVGDPSEIGMLIGLGMILLTPQLVDQVKGILKTKSPNFPAISGAIGVGRGVAGKPFKEMKHEYFGKDAFGQPRIGTQWVQSRLGRTTAALLAGGSFDRRHDDKNNIVNLKGVGFKDRVKNLGKFSDKSLRESLVDRGHNPDSDKPTTPPTPPPPDDDGSGGGTGGGSGTGGSGGTGGGSGGGGGAGIGRKILTGLTAAVAPPLAPAVWKAGRGKPGDAAPSTEALDSDAIAVPGEGPAPEVEPGDSAPEGKARSDGEGGDDSGLTAEEMKEAVREGVEEGTSGLKGAITRSGEREEGRVAEGTREAMSEAIPHITRDLGDIVAKPEDKDDSSSES